MVYRHEGVYDGRFKLMYFYDIDEWELYDLEKDPNETNNIYNVASQELISELKSQLKSLQIKYNDDITIEEMKVMTDTVIRRAYNEPNKLKNKKS